jgi:hypothetical protein
MPVTVRTRRGCDIVPLYFTSTTNRPKRARMSDKLVPEPELGAGTGATKVSLDDVPLA